MRVILVLARLALHREIARQPGAVSGADRMEVRSVRAREYVLGEDASADLHPHSILEPRQRHNLRRSRDSPVATSENADSEKDRQEFWVHTIRCSTNRRASL